MARGRLSDAVRSGGIVLVGVLLLSGCANVVGAIVNGVGDLVERSAPQPSIPAGSTKLEDLVVGDCMEDDAILTEVILAVQTIDCDLPHGFEVYHTTLIPDLGYYPGEDKSTAIGADECLDSFAGFAGAGYGDSSLEYYYFFPTEGRWVAGFQEITCFVGDLAGEQLVGTAQGRDAASATPPPTESPVDAVAIAPAELALGDCFDYLQSSSSDVIIQVGVVPCAQPHVYEVFAVPDLIGDQFPGEEQSSKKSDAACLRRFAEFVGVDYDHSALDFRYFFPDGADWRGGDRTAICYLMKFSEEPRTGSARNSGI